MFMVVVTVDKQTGNIVGRPEVITRGFVHLNEQDPIMAEAIDRVMASIQNPATLGQVALLKSQIKDGVSASCTSRRSGGRWSSLSWWRSRWPGHAAPPQARGAVVGRPQVRRSTVSPDVVRSLVGIALLVAGVVILIGLMLPGDGALTDWSASVIAPWFGSGRWTCRSC